MPKVPSIAGNFLSPSQPVLPLDSVVDSLRSSIPDVEWMLGEIESQQGWFRFPSFIASNIENLKIQSYPVLYTNERAIAAVFLKGFLNEDQIRELNTELEEASLAERGEFLREMIVSVSETIDQIEIPKTPADQAAAHKKFLSLPPDEQKEVIRVSQHFYAFFLSSFFQSLATMVHGEKLTSLVAQAMSGNDDAFVKAVQIDRRILTEIPYFKERFVRAQMESNQNFSDLISYRLRVAPYRGKIRHKALWHTFSILDQTGLLSTLRHREILEVCDEVGIGGFESRIQSEKHLGDRLREYREFQKRGIVTTP